jgi:hypothetical protein
MSYGPLGTTLRLCDWPPCHASYEAFAVLDGKAKNTGWLGPSSLGFDMCGVHVPLTFGDRDPLTGPHCPILDHDTKTSRCSCGFTLTTTMRPQTVSIAFYRAHLLDLVCELGGCLYPADAPYACAVTDCATCAIKNPDGVFTVKTGGAR